jgi:hypothetical protein
MAMGPFLEEWDIKISVDALCPLLSIDLVWEKIGPRVFLGFEVDGMV